MRYLGTVVVPANRSRNNLTTGAAVLDLAGLGDAKLSCKVRFIVGGIAGNDWTIAATGDSAAGAGVSIVVSVVAKTVVIHYESNVSTDGDVEAAIAALTGTSQVIAVDLAGTTATVLVAPGTNFAATHLASGVAGAFDLPRYAKGLSLVLPAEAAGWDIKTGPGPALEATTNEPNQGAAGATLQVPLGRWGTSPVVALHNGGAGGSVKVSVEEGVMF